MGVLAIHLNDTGIRAARAGADGLLRVDGAHEASPGVAWRQDHELVTGCAAARQSSRHPLHIHDRFWDRLDVESLDRRDARAPNHAEVACAHLRQVVDTARGADDDDVDEVVVAVPPFYDRRQLGILVAIARELELSLRALVAAPLALELDATAAGAIVVIDLTRHRGIVSVVETGDDGRITLAATRVNPDTGLLAFRRQWIKAIGAEFVRKTRFDPLHDGATEQQLHDRLPGALDALIDDDRAELELEVGSSRHHLTVTVDLLAQAAHGLVVAIGRDVQTLARSLDQSRPPLSALLIAHEAARAPGLRTSLARLVAAPMRALEPGAAALGLSRLWPGGFDTGAVTAGVAYHAARTGVPLPDAAG